MTLDSTHRDRHSRSLRAGSALGEIAGGMVARKLVSLVDIGKLSVITPAGEAIETQNPNPGADAVWTLRNWRALRRLFLQGDLGFAQSYIDGDWTTPDLTALIGLADRNTSALLKFIDGYRAMRLFNRMRHRLRPNTRRGSRKNIVAHYDLGNDFYKLWLDPTMTYSSAIFERVDDTLEEAQRRKIAHIVDLLDAPQDGSVLEIGCGWGALSRAIADAGVAKVTGLTLSPSQRAIALEAVRGTPLELKTDIRLQDYRDVRGQFDRIVSIEMIEAVGEQYWPVYFKAIHDRLRPGGHAIVQAITICEERYESYRSSVDFIQRYIFPGGMLPTPQIVAAQSREAGLVSSCCRTFGQSYARTLAIWRQRFNDAWPDIAAQGFDDRFRRMWDYYLAYCESGFANGTIDVGLYKLHKPA